MTRWLSSGGRLLEFLKGFGEGARNKVSWRGGDLEEWEDLGPACKRLTLLKSRQLFSDTELGLKFPRLSFMGCWKCRLV